MFHLRVLIVGYDMSSSEKLPETICSELITCLAKRGASAVPTMGRINGVCEGITVIASLTVWSTRHLAALAAPVKYFPVVDSVPCRFSRHSIFVLMGLSEYALTSRYRTASWKVLTPHSAPFLHMYVYIRCAELINLWLKRRGVVVRTVPIYTTRLYI